MPPADLHRDVLLAAIGAVVLVVCGLIAHSGRVSGPERAVFHAVNDLPGWLYPVMWPLQQLGNLVAGFVVVVAALVLRRWRLALAALILSLVDVEPIVKALVVRSRPGTTVPDAVLLGDVPVAGQSFPSGHAVLIASLAVICTPYLRGRWRLVPWVLVAGVCVGRVYVGAHNPLDVIGGCGLGLVLGAAADIVVHLPVAEWWRSLLGRRSARPSALAVDHRTVEPPPVQARARLRRFGPLVVAGSLVLVGVACAGSPARPPSTALDDDAVTVGSFDFAESRLLGEIYSQALEGAHYAVHRAFSLGAREFVAPALQRGLLELVPDYAGAAVQFLSLGDEPQAADAEATHRALVAGLTGTPVVALAAAPAENVNTFVLTGESALRLGVRTLSDLARVAPSLRLGGPPECPRRPSCLLGLGRAYGASFQRFVPLDAGGPITLEALQGGDIDVALLFSTDPAINEHGLVELVDDRGLQPAENVTPLVRAEVVDRWGPELVAVVDAVSAHLTTEALRHLNGLATSEPPAVVASGWLAAEGLR